MIPVAVRWVLFVAAALAFPALILTVAIGAWL